MLIKKKYMKYGNEVAQQYEFSLIFANDASYIWQGTGKYCKKRECSSAISHAWSDMLVLNYMKLDQINASLKKSGDICWLDVIQQIDFDAELFRKKCIRFTSNRFIFRVHVIGCSAFICILFKLGYAWMGYSRNAFCRTIIII